MDGAELFVGCLTTATGVVKQVRREHLANATPDTDWNVRDLLNHMLYEVAWVPSLLEGKTIADVGDAYEGDLVGDTDIDLSVHWQEKADLAEAAADAADPEEISHLSYGDVTNDAYLTQIGSDLLIHAWDLGRAIGIHLTFDQALAQEVYDQTLPRLADMQKSELFAPPLGSSNEDSIQTKVLALYGRDSNWQATT